MHIFYICFIVLVIFVAFAGQDGGDNNGKGVANGDIARGKGFMRGVPSALENEAENGGKKAFGSESCRSGLRNNGGDPCVLDNEVKNVGKAAFGSGESRSSCQEKANGGGNGVQIACDNHHFPVDPAAAF